MDTPYLESAKSPKINTVEIKTVTSNLLFAQPIENGFQLIDATPKVVFKIYKTSNPSCFIAVKEAINGVLILKDNDWFFEYYQINKLFSEKVLVKF